MQTQHSLLLPAAADFILKSAGEQVPQAAEQEPLSFSLFGHFFSSKLPCQIAFPFSNSTLLGKARQGQIALQANISAIHRL